MKKASVKPVRTESRLDQLFIGHYAELVGWCRKHIVRSLGDPEDFVHAAYLRCQSRWSQCRSSPRRAEAYMYRALGWVLADALRKLGRRLPREQRDEFCRPTVPREALRALVVKEAIKRLRGFPGCVLRRILAGQDEAAICREMKISRSALAVHRSRAKVALCRYLELSQRKARTPRRPGM